MGILLPQMVDVTITSGNVNHLLAKGYTIPTHRSKWKYKKDGYVSYNLGDTISVSVNHLQPNSHVKIKFICDRCGISFERELASHARKSKDGRSFCAKCCMVGDATSLYKENITDEERILKRNYYEYKHFRESVYVRDKYTCQCCGYNGQNIELHHLNSYHANEDGRTDIDNAITLCHDCHTAFHVECGKGENTKEQFYDWLKVVRSQRVYNGEINPYRPVYCFENSTLYRSPQECAADCGISVIGKIYQMCNQSKNIYSLCGKHFMWGDIYLSMSKQELEVYFHNRFTDPKKKKVACLGDKTIYMSAEAAARHYNLTGKSVIHSCEQKQTKRALGYLSNGSPITFAYYDDFINMCDSDISRINATVIKDKLRKKVIHISTNTIYDNQQEAYNSGAISRFLLKKYCEEAQHGDISHGWMYYDDYKKLTNMT